MKKITTLNGKSAVFVRGFIEYCLEPGTPTPALRKAQEAGMEAVNELNEDISMPYISKLSKLLQEEQVVFKSRAGRHFELFPGRNLDNLSTFLTENPTWGTSTKREDSADQIQARSEFLDEMKNVGLVRIEAHTPLNKAAYAIAQQKFKAGEYDMVFIRSNVHISEIDSNDL